MMKQENRSLNPFKFKMMLYVVFVCSLVYVPRGLDALDSAAEEDCAMMLNDPSPQNPENDDSTDFPLEDEHSGHCIRYKDVNDALRKAAEEQNYEPSDRDPTKDNLELDRIARLIVETTRNLAKNFQLTPEEINSGLPTIDTSKTDIWDICPNKYKPTPCTVTRFRSADGQCSNLNNSVIGMARTAYPNFFRPQYSDGVDGLKVSPVDGGPLPNPREISHHTHSDVSHTTDSRSILMISWGQLIAHDISLGDFARTPTGHIIQCCVDGPKPHPNCNPIPVSETDSFYWRYNATCMEGQRILAGLRPRCALGPRAPTNFFSTILDANYVYGNSHDEAMNLRALENGLLRTSKIHQDLGLKDLLPPMIDTPDYNCFGRPEGHYCFLSGDTRASFQPHMAALHHVFLREHNRIATEFGRLNPHWDDERLYQEARHLVIALTQHICYNELLPLLLGPTNIKTYSLTLEKEGYYNGYDKNMLLITDQATQTAASRWGHTLMPNAISLYNKDHEVVGSLELFTTIGQPFNLWAPGMIDKVLGGIINSQMESFDRFMTQQLTHHLFQTPQTTYGLDLAAQNILRGRDVGLAGYNDYRELCGMPRAETFEQLNNDLGNDTARRFSEIYRHPDDIDLWSAGISEYPVEGGSIGPTFACMFSRQFSRLRRGDRFWYENSGFPSSFTPGQLREIRKITQAKVSCENADDLPTIQKWSMLLPDPETNPRVQCTDLPEVDLNFWTEDPQTGEFVNVE